MITLVAAACGNADTPYELTQLEQVAAAMKPHMVHAPDGDVPAVVKAEVARAHNVGADVVVYIGATWCEPCRRFKHALAAHRLDRLLAGVEFLEFDFDQSEQQLNAAGYAGRLIPRFVVPDARGRGGPLRTEGSVKGPTGVANILPRLRAVVRQLRENQR